MGISSFCNTKYYFQQITGKLLGVEEMENLKNVHVAVVATMSAGKSTLLNAIIGRDLLPAKNEACTATIYKIANHNNKGVFEARYKAGESFSKWESATKDLLNDWNDKPVEQIEICGALQNINNPACDHRIVLFDTPGVNNALEDKHAKITKKLISKSNLCMMICVLDASALGVKDEWRLLMFIKKELDKNANLFEPVFVINKIDLLDVECGENPCDIIKGTQEYLEELGFSSPIIIPTSSNLSLAIRKTLQTAERMTVKEDCEDYRGAAKLKSFFSRRYKSTTTPRQQKNLRNQVNVVLALEQEYCEALNNSPALQTTLKDLRKIQAPTPHRKIKIGGEYFTYADLYRVDGLSGVPYLEKIIENKLKQYARKHKRSK